MNDSTKLRLRPPERRTPQSASRGGGTEFTPPVKTGALAKGATATQKVEKPKILLLDDEERILNALSALFRYKYQVFTATDGEQALAILKQCHVHVVVSDQRMPAMTGVEFLRRAKAVSPNTVRILLTGFSDLSAVIDSVNDGEVYRFLNKPWGNQEIQAVIADAMGIGIDLQSTETTMRADESPALGNANDAADDSASRSPAIVMMHDNRDAFEQIRPLLDDSHPFVYAQNLDECLDALQRRSVAVIVSDLKIGKHDCSELLKLLKREHPQILTIVLADGADTERVIDLINQAKIFRYVLSPCKPQKLKFFIDSALTHFQRSRANPALLREQKVDPTLPGAQTGARAMIVARLRSLRSFLTPRPTPN
jgi:eukaryotic-like serine/threonine-protein kinase